MDIEDTDKIAIDLLLEAIFQQYGYDFRNYARGTIHRRVTQFANYQKVDSIADLIPSVLHNEECAFRLIQRFSIAVSELFRDPHIYVSLRNHVLPLLKTYPSFKVWHAGCANGEEVYSLAIILKEEGLLERATIFATDFNNEALNAGKRGIYPVTDLSELEKSYLQAGGKASFSDYCHSDHRAICMSSDLKKHITFANHNLTQDASFGEMHLILCRNVLIYFDFNLQKNALNLLSDSLVNGGFMCLGSSEDMMKSHNLKYFKEIDQNARIYQKSISGKLS